MKNEEVGVELINIHNLFYIIFRISFKADKFVGVL